MLSNADRGSTTVYDDAVAASHMRLGVHRYVFEEPAVFESGMQEAGPSHAEPKHGAPMRTIGRTMCVLGCLCGTSAQTLHAQLGGVMDFIHKLSGPRLTYDGVTFRFGYQPGQRIDRDLVTRLDIARNRVAARDLAVEPERAARDAMSACINDIVTITQGTDSDIAFAEGKVDRARVALNQHVRMMTEESLRAAPAATPRFAALRAAVCETRDDFADLLNDVDPNHGFVARVGIFTGYDADNDDRTGKIYSTLIQGTLEYRFRLEGANLGVETGFAAHYFHGDISPFWHRSYPLLLNFHPFARSRFWLLRNFRLGGGVHVFKPFDDDAFVPVLPPQDEGWEVKGSGFVGLDISLSSLPLRRARITP